MEQKEEPGKVQIKAILKGNAAVQAIRPAAASGFKLADFQLNPTMRETPEDYLKNEVNSLQSKIAALNSEIASSQKKTEQDVKAAREKGFNEGKVLGNAEGEKKALEQWNELLKNLQSDTEKSLEAIANQQREIFAKIEGSCADVALAIAKRVFCEEAAKNPNIVSHVLKEAFTFLGQEEAVKVRLNPMDIKYAEETESFWKPMMTRLKNIEIILDKAIERGGCLLESENGSSVDMRIETVFGHISEAVKKIYSSQEPAQSA